MVINIIDRSLTYALVLISETIKFSQMEIEISAVDDLEAMVLKDPAPTRVPRK